MSDPSGPIEGRLDVAKVIDHMAPSVVTISADIDSQFGQGQSTGTGVIISSDGEILTNAHVVEGATEIRVRLAGETEPREARLLAADPGNDLALLRMSGDELRRGGVRRPRQRPHRRRGRGDRLRTRPRR